MTLYWLYNGFAFAPHWLLTGIPLASHWNLHGHRIGFAGFAGFAGFGDYLLTSYWLCIGITLDSHWLHRLRRLCIGFILEFRWASHWLFRLCRLWRLFIDFVLASHWYHIGFTLAALALQWLRIGSAMAPHWLCNGFALAPQWLRKALTFGEYSVNCARGMTVTLFEGSYLLLPFNGSFYAVTLLKASYLR